METMRYKPSDKVRIKSLDWYNENKNETYDVECSNNIRFDRYMSKFCGKVMTISHVGVDYYTMVKDLVGYWTDEMIEGLAEEENENYSKVIDNGVSNPIIAKTSSATIDTDKGFYSYSDSDDNLEMEWNLPQGYVFKDENGNVINATKIVLEKKKKEYPKTYKECCETMQVARPIIWFGYNDVHSISKKGDEYESHIENTLCAFRKLLICRDAYWKIAGEEMGLRKPWEPDWENDDHDSYPTITRCGGKIIKTTIYTHDCPFSFPTEEMRNAFYENFKELIESCKEFL